jgi:hypothetical protein
MTKFIVALLATGLMGSAFAQSAPSQQPAPAPQAAPATTTTVPGAKSASASSMGELTPFYVVAGVAVAGAIVIAAGGGSSKHGTTGTH